MSSQTSQELLEKLNLSRFDYIFLLGIPISFFLINGFYSWQEDVQQYLNLPVAFPSYFIYSKILLAVILAFSAAYIFAYLQDNLTYRLYITNGFYHCIVIFSIPFVITIYQNSNEIFYSSFGELRFLALSYNSIFFVIGGIFCYRILGVYFYSYLINWLKHNTPNRFKEIEGKEYAQLFLWPYTSLKVTRNRKIFSILPLPELIFTLFALYFIYQEARDPLVGLYLFFFGQAFYFIPIKIWPKKDSNKFATSKKTKKRINLAEVTHSKWDNMLSSYNEIVVKVNQISFNHFMHTASFRTKNGTVVNLNDWDEKMRSLLYKLRYACVSLGYLRETYQKYAGTKEDAMESLNKKISEDFIFHMDIFFSFAYSAFDIVAGLLNLIIETGLQQDKIYFNSFIQSLVKSKNLDDEELFRDLQRDNEKGWIHDFRKYRIFTTHYAFIPLSKRFEYIAKDQSIEVNLFLLPDDPKVKPFSYKRKRELVPYCESEMNKELDTMKRLLDYINSMI